MAIPLFSLALAFTLAKAAAFEKLLDLLTLLLAVAIEHIMAFDHIKKIAEQEGIAEKFKRGDIIVLAKQVEVDMQFVISKAINCKEAVDYTLAIKT